MSGGSYDYLCFKDASDIFSSGSENLARMADRLDGVCPEAAAETRALFDGPGSLRAELEARIARLADLWHDVEWRDSGDYGDSQVAVAVAAFRAQDPPPDMLVGEVARLQEIGRLTARALGLLEEAERVATRSAVSGVEASP